MKHQLLFCLVLLLMLLTGFLKAQKTLLAAGNMANGSGGSATYSVGQIDYLQKGTNAQVMEGVQHAYEIITLALEDLAGKDRNILLYPNPVRDVVFVEFGDQNYQSSDYILFDSQGRQLKTGRLNQQKSELDFSLLPSSVYIMQILQKDQKVKTFKIIKK